MKKVSKSLILLLATLSGISLSDTDKNLSETEFEEKFNYDDFADKLSETKSVDALTALTTNTGDEALKNENTQLKADKQELTDKLTVAEKFKTDNEAKLADVALVEEVRAEVLADVERMAQVVDKTNFESLKETYAASNLKTLRAFQTSLSTQLEEKFPMSCSSCGSKEVNRSTVKEDESGKGGAGKLSATQIITKARTSNSGMDDFWGEDK